MKNQLDRIRGKLPSFIRESPVMKRIEKAAKRRLAIFMGWAIFLGLIATVELIIIRTWHPFAGTLTEDVPIWEIFFSVFGLVYAILVGLLIVEGHRRWRELSSAIQREINAIADIHDFLYYFKAPVDKAPRQKIIKALLEYFKGEFKTDWWRKLTREDRYYHRDNVLRVIDSVENLKPKDAQDRYAVEVIMGKVSEMTSSRNERLQIMRQKLHSTFYVLLIFMSVVIVTGFCFLGVKDQWLHWSLVFVTTVSLCALFMMLYDLDHPIQGFWNIGEEVSEPIEIYIARLENDLKRQRVRSSESE